MPKITPCLWFDGKAEEAARFYTSVFKNSKMGAITRYGETGPGKKGSVLTVTFQIQGQEFMGLNGGPEFQFSEAVSFVVNCKTQREVDAYWGKLLKGGKPSQCGWLKDKFGLSWQIVPTILPHMLQAKDRAKADRVMKAVMTMVKLDIKKLKEAFGEE